MTPSFRGAASVELWQRTVATRNLEIPDVQLHI